MLEKMSYEEYESRPGIRQSSLGNLEKNPALFRFALEHPTEKEDFTFGRAFHTLILEPVMFDDQFETIPEGCKKGSREWKAVVESGRQPLRFNEDKELEAMAASVRAHKTASQILALCPEKEMSIFWKDKQTGVECKARLDAPCPGIEVVADLKSTKGVAKGEFAKSIHNYKYAYQAAHTLNGCAALGLPFSRFVFIGVEKEEPYQIAVYELDQPSIIYAAAKVQELLWLYKRCMESGIWPGYPDEIQQISLPPWATKNWENEE